MAESGTLGLYAKAVVSALAAAAAVALQGLANGDLATDEWVAVFVAFIVGLGAVLAVPNAPEGVKKVLKAIIAAVVAGAAVLTTAILAGGPFVFTLPLLLKIVLAALGALGITWLVPNAAESDPRDPVSNKIRAIRNKGAYQGATSEGAAPGGRYADGI